MSRLAGADPPPRASHGEAGLTVVHWSMIQKGLGKSPRKRKGMKVHLSSLLAAMLLALATPAFSQEWREGFEGGVGSVSSYHADAPTVTPVAVEGDAAEGKRFLRAALPGKRALEGVRIRATGLEGGRLATVTAKVRGQGEVWLCLLARNGWLYAPQTQRLTGQWQEISLSKVIPAADNGLGIHFLSKTVQTDAVFEVDDIRVTQAPAPKVYDAEVGPWRFEAEAHAQRPRQVADLQAASGGKVVRDPLYIALEGLPFPRTSRPVHVYVKVQPGAPDEDYRLITNQGGVTQTLASVKPGKPGQWQWLRFAPVTAGEAGDTFGISCWRKAGAPEAAAIDAVVLSTKADLDDAALDRAPLLLGDRPLAVVSRAKAAPKIDGVADDPCWASSVACTGFLVGRSLAPASAPTTVRLCWDDTRLYLLFECEEPILNVAMQRRHEFLAKITERDGRVYDDDAVIALLDPSNTGKQVFDFTINALGTIADARCPGPDLWATRDITWNSGAVAKGTIGANSWSVELAIPFADLGQTPRPGDVWQACLGRIAKARKETTSWNPSNRGFHDPYALGRLVFAGETPGVVMATPEAIQPGRNTATAEFPAAPEGTRGAYLFWNTRSPAANRHILAFGDLAKAPARLACPLDIKEDAELEVALGVLDAATLQPLYLTPAVKRAVRSTMATLTLACDGPYEVLVNDEVVAQGPASAGTEPIQIPLKKGPNVFALRLEKGTAAMRLEAPGWKGEAVRWRMAPASTRDATLATTDDSTWAIAPKAGDHPKLGAVLGDPGKPVILRHTLLWEKTRTWPTPSPALYIARDSAQHLTFIADGLPGRKLVDWSVTLAVPPAFEILGATGYYGERDPQPIFRCTQLGEREVDGKKMRLARITADKPVLSGRHYIMSLFNAFVRTRPGASLEGNETRFLYWSEANDGTVTEPVQEIPVRILPPLKGKQPKQLVWQLWGSFFGNMDDPAMREETLRTAQAAGFNDIVSGSRWTSDNAPRFGMTHTMGTNFQPWSINLGPYLEAHPNECLIDREGKPSKSLLCTTLLLDQSWPAVEAALKERLDEARPHIVDYDFEYNPFDGPHSCYCQRCLKAFREFARIPAETPLDAATIKEKHDEAWTDFMARRVAQVFAKLKDGVRRVAPGTKLSAYSGYQTPDNPRTYGVNWAYFGELKAADRAGCGYGRPVEHIPGTIQALNGIPVLFGALMTPYDTSITAPQVPIPKARLLRRSLDSTGGVLVYDRLPMDGRTWLAVAETTRLVAEFEPLFLTGKRSALQGHDPAVVQLLSDGKTTLVCAMNDSSASVERRITLPADAGDGTEFYSGKKVKAGETVACALAPGEAAVYVLKR